MKTLPEERQAMIFDMLRGKTLAQACAELRADGLNTSAAALSEFFSWYSLKQDFARKQTLAEEFCRQIKAGDPDISEAKLFEHGQAVFALLALEEKDAKTWKRVQDVRHRRQIIALEREKFQRETAELFLKWSEDRRAQEIVGAGGVSQSEKIERLGQLMFGDEWGAKEGKGAKGN